MGDIWTTLKGIPPEYLIVVAALFVLWGLIDKVVAPLIKAKLYSNGHDRRTAPAEPDHQRIIDTLGAKIDVMNSSLVDHRRETKADFREVHSRIDRIIDGRPVGRAGDD